MKENKTQPSNQSIEGYISQIVDESRRSDSIRLLDIMKQATGIEPVLWGSSIVGFGSYHYKYKSGREGDSLKVGFAARKQAIVLYGLVFYDQNHDNNELLEKLGPHKRGKGCLYIKKLPDIDVTILKQMIKNSYNNTNRNESDR